MNLANWANGNGQTLRLTLEELVILWQILMDMKKESSKESGCAYRQGGFSLGLGMRVVIDDIQYK